MRGKVADKALSTATLGITPAYAGKRSASFCKLPTPKDHPRLCGEKQAGSLSHKRIDGSPPPMRGKEAMIWVSSPRLRITPAYAGKRVG